MSAVRNLVVVHDAAWDDLVHHYGARGIDVVRVPIENDDPEDDTEHYILSPRSLGRGPR